MVISERKSEFTGMSIQDGMYQNYREKDGKITWHYLDLITKKLEYDAREFEIALKAFHYNFPFDGKYRISWKIERIEDDNQ